MDDDGVRSPSAFGPLTIFVVWLGFLLCVVYLAGAPVNVPPPLQRAVSNWDTGWYLSIVNDGYATEVAGEANVAFFPVYPLLMRWFSQLGPDPVTAGVVVSLVCFVAALFVLNRLLRERESPAVASNTLLLMAFWPFSFFFALAYTEALFLLLAAGAFYLVHKERWWAAAACAGVASGTRVVGVFLALAVVAAFFQKQGWRPSPRILAKTAGLGLAGVSGLLAFMTYLHFHTGNALAFVEVQRFWHNRGQGIAGLRWIPEVLRHRPAATYEYFSVLVYLIPFVLFLGLALFVLIRRDAAWGAFSTLTLVAPVPTGNIASTNRYVLVLFPCFVVVAELLKDRTPLVVAASAALLGLFAYHYVFHPSLSSADGQQHAAPAVAPSVQQAASPRIDSPGASARTV